MSHNFKPALLIVIQSGAKDTKDYKTTISALKKHVL